LNNKLKHFKTKPPSVIPALSRNPGQFRLDSRLRGNDKLCLAIFSIVNKYDNLGRIATIDAGTGYVKFDYAYVAKTNNIDSIQFDHRTGQPYNTFQYDGLDRITNVQYLSNQNDVEAFSMDDLGSRTGANTQRDGVFTYNSASPNLTNRYTSIYDGQTTHNLAYDAAGNLTADKDGYQYVYDYENRVVSISKLWGETEVPVADYVYDALGRRIQRTVYREGNLYYTDRFYYNDSWQYLMKEMYWPGDDPVCVNFVYGNYIDELLLCQNGISSRYYYLHDHLYSPAAAISSSGTILERYEYDVYGNQRIFDNSWQTRAYSWFYSFGLTGREIDMLDWDTNDTPHLQHMHYRHRDYSPFMGRFIQQDPLGINPVGGTQNSYNPLGQYIQGLNIYEYVQSSPLLKTDPYGLDDPGCDVIGDLGNHCFRRCCAKHDQCYHNCVDPSNPSQKKPCKADSWWPWGRPECQKCNDAVFWCFATHLICDWSDTDRDYYGECTDGNGSGYGKERNPDKTKVICNDHDPRDK